MRILFILLFSSSLMANPINCSLEHFNLTNVNCDLEILSITEAMIDVYQKELKTQYNRKKLPSGNDFQIYKQRLEKLTDLMNIHNQCIKDISPNTICGKDGYDLLSAEHKKLDTYPNTTNEEIRIKNAAVRKFNALNDQYKNCPRHKSCMFNLVFNKERTPLRLVNFAQESAISFIGDKCKTQYPDDRFLYVTSHHNNDTLITSLNGRMELRTRMVCKVNGRNIPTQRKIILTPTTALESNSSTITILDDFKDFNGHQGTGLNRYPIARVFTLPKDPAFEDTPNGIMVKWGNSPNDPFLLIDPKTGLITNSNLFQSTPSFYNQNNCSTTIKGNKLYPNLKLNERYNFRSHDLRG